MADNLGQINRCAFDDCRAAASDEAAAAVTDPFRI